MNLHGCGDPCIVNLDALHLVLDDERSPLQIIGSVVVQDGQNGIKAVQPFLGLLGCEAKTIPVCGPGAHVPEFCDVLGKYANGLVRGENRLDGREGRLARWKALLNTEYQYVRVEEHRHSQSRR